jgi:hypothetical protein
MMSDLGCRLINVFTGKRLDVCFTSVGNTDVHGLVKFLDSNNRFDDLLFTEKNSVYLRFPKKKSFFALVQRDETSGQALVHFLVSIFGSIRWSLSRSIIRTSCFCLTCLKPIHFFWLITNKKIDDCVSGLAMGDWILFVYLFWLLLNFLCNL